MFGAFYLSLICNIFLYDIMYHWRPGGGYRTKRLRFYSTPPPPPLWVSNLPINQLNLTEFTEKSANCLDIGFVDFRNFRRHYDIQARNRGGQNPARTFVYDLHCFFLFKSDIIHFFKYLYHGVDVS